MKPNPRNAALVLGMQFLAVSFWFSICSAQVYQTEFGSTGAANGQFSAPVGIALDASGNIYVVDTGNNRVQKFDSALAH
jgi:DNA-binding beta-propeller fold protein YncE